MQLRNNNNSCDFLTTQYFLTKEHDKKGKIIQVSLLLSLQLYNKNIATIKKYQFYLKSKNIVNEIYRPFQNRSDVKLKYTFMNNKNNL